MRRRPAPAGTMTPADGVFWWREYPGPEPADPAAVADWSARFVAWCEEHGVDSGDVTNEAAQLGLTDIPWNPYESGAL